MQTSDVKTLIRGPMAPVLTVYKNTDFSLDLAAIQENVDQQIHRGMTRGNGVLLAAGAGGDFLGASANDIWYESPHEQLALASGARTSPPAGKVLGQQEGRVAPVRRPTFHRARSNTLCSMSR